MEEITIRIGKNGKVDLSVLGAKGTKCTDLTKKLEAALGTIESSKKTGEFYEQDNTVSNEQTQSGG